MNKSKLFEDAMIFFKEELSDQLFETYDDTYLILKDDYNIAIDNLREKVIEAIEEWLKQKRLYYSNLQKLSYEQVIKELLKELEEK